MTYKKALKTIESLLVFGSKPGLDRIGELMERIGSPEMKLKFVHVAGTNGKGSVCAYLSSILQQAGYKTGLFISPYVVDFRERFQINGEMIPEELFAELVEMIEPVVKQMKKEKKIITEFEMVFAVAIAWFCREKCDVVVLETGLGGRFDATNIIDTPLASVITSISLDHTAVLGDTVEKIAFEKSGIIKPDGITVVYGDQPDGVIDVIKKAADERNNRLCIADPASVQKISADLDGSHFRFHAPEYEDGLKKQYEISMLGEYQLKNAATALYTVAALRTRGMYIPEAAVCDGLKKAFMPARLEVFSKEPVVILDGAHNPGGAASLRDAVSELLPERQRIGIVGMLADKDVKGALSVLVPLFDRLITLTPDNPRAMSAGELANLITELGGKAEPMEEYEAAYEKALSYTDDEGAVIVFGSLYLASDMRKIILKKTK